MKTALVIHGHFYQPARENPWTGLIPRQPSAAPYENWNARITRECYAANAASRVLDPQGNILDIVNNYAHISFNFGPTLLSWLEGHAPSVYERILQADRESVAAHGGHGNAIAQAYNHVILPLAAPEDIRTQLHWGLRDFEVRFGRRSEGMWLPETAVSPAVIDALIEEEVRFIVLSPWQAEAWCPVGSQKWKPLGSEPIPSHRAYRIDRPAGSIAVFFYHPQLAHGLSFEHYLRDADALYQRLLQIRHGSTHGALIHAATDGEVYGHHEPFGDMCLAALIRKVQSRGELELTNYGAFLEKHPPAHLARLKAGEEERGTSWSCAHGVSRWYRDCGCSTGGGAGWNQRWRTPLREALENLRLDLCAVYTARLARLTDRDPFEVRNRYVDVLTGAADPEPFARWALGPHGDSAPPRDGKPQAETAREPTGDRPPSAAEREELFALLEGQRFAQLMFVSCAWFFADISGIEAVQNLAAAQRAIDLYAPFSGEEPGCSFAEDLEMARSNLPEEGSGSNILENRVFPLRRGPSFGAALFVLMEIFRRERSLRVPGEESELPWEAFGRSAAGAQCPVCGIFRRERLVLREDGVPFPECTGEVAVSIRPGLGAWGASFRLERTSEMGLTLRLRPAGGGPEAPCDLSELPERVRQGILEYLSRSLFARSGLQRGSLERSLELVAFGRVLQAPLPAQVIPLGEAALEAALEETIAPFYDSTVRLPSAEEMDRLQALLRVARERGFRCDADRVAGVLTHVISRQADCLPAAAGDGPQIRTMLRILELAGGLGLRLDLTRLQRAVFERLPAAPGAAFGEPLLMLAAHVGINVERFRQPLRVS